jgi:nucleotide-binding universal stress UspA family protein
MTPLGPDANPQAVPYKILIAVAFDPTSESALLEGAKLARRTPGSELHIVHVASQSDGGGGTLSLLPSTDGPESPADALRRRVEFVWAQTGGMTVLAHIRSGDPAKEILQLAIDLAADLIVVGSHQRSGLQRLVLGSVAERVLHESHCPVLRVVPKDYGETVPSPRIEPACADCLTVRARSANAQFWCERHSKPYLAPHVYVPRDEVRTSMMPAT